MHYQAPRCWNQNHLNEETIVIVNEKLNKINNITEKVQEYMSEISKGANHLIDLNLSMFYDHLNHMTLLEESAFFHIFIYLVLLLIIFNILTSLFGNEIIKYFDLENKFPSTARFLNLRYKFQRYYLLWNISLMFILCILAICINLLVLF